MPWPEKTIRLVEGRHWVTVAPLVGTIAQVVDGTVHWPGDLMARPEDVSWEDAATTNGRGDTALSPFDLETLYDAVTDWMYRPDLVNSAIEAVELTSAELPGTMRTLRKRRRAA